LALRQLALDLKGGGNMSREVDLMRGHNLYVLSMIGFVVRESGRLWRQEEGQDLAEYGLLVLVLGLAAIAAMKNLACSVSAVFTSASTSLTSAS